MEHVPQPEAESARSGAIGCYDRWNRRFFAATSVAILAGMTLLIGADVILRLVAGAPIRGTHDIVGMGLLALVVCSLPYSWRADVHVRMDMLYGQYGPVMKLIVDLLSAATALIFGLLLAWQAARYVPDIYRRQSATVTLGIPYWPFALAIALSATAFSISIIIESILLFRAGRRKG